MHKKGYIGIDFDGTIVDQAYPNIGEPLPYAFQVLKDLQIAGYHLILWTCREDGKKRKHLAEAIKFCEEHGVYFDAVNETPENNEFRDEDGQKRRKIHCDYIVDDRATFGFDTPHIDWLKIGKFFLGKDYTPPESKAA